MNEINETLSVQANLVKMIQELTNVSSYKASSLAGENEILLNYFFLYIHINAYNYTIYIQTIKRRYHGEQKTMTTPWPVHRKNHTTLKEVFINNLKGNLKKSGRN